MLMLEGVLFKPDHLQMFIRFSYLNFLSWRSPLRGTARVFFFSLMVAGPFLAGQSDQNETGKSYEVVRVVQPGVFDLRSDDFLVRMRAWGVGFPDKNQPGYEKALDFTEKCLLEQKVYPVIKSEFDSDNLKVVELFMGDERDNFSQLAIADGMGWHLEQETRRFGLFVIAQIKAKRKGLGIWQGGTNLPPSISNQNVPVPLLRSITGREIMPRSINYWVTSMGKIHRPGCSFYERGKGTLSPRPTGADCRICGGTTARKP